ncbi:peroxidase-related enzyme [Acidobacteria bacterium AH-259-O06]|nr:peroxidase-related enzyme [Acidobacteria bacterium AH-259-O06]
MTQDEALLEAVKSNYRKAPISTAERAILDFAVKLTNRPNQMARTDLQPLTEQGFDDTAILEIVQIVGFFNYINRVADALGVDPEPEWAQPGGEGIKNQI